MELASGLSGAHKDDGLASFQRKGHDEVLQDVQLLLDWLTYLQTPYSVCSFVEGDCQFICC